jgi:hypothetical protein
VYNQRERQSAAFITIRDSVTMWKIDFLQILVEDNRRMLLFPDWFNTSDYHNTANSFLTVAVHARELHEALQGHQITGVAKKAFMSNQKFCCTLMGVQALFLPLSRAAELKLFDMLILRIRCLFTQMKSSPSCQHTCKLITNDRSAIAVFRMLSRK